MSRYQEQGYASWEPRPGPSRRPARRIQTALVLIGTIFAVVLAAVVGQRLSDQAISVLAGAVCGVGASIPTSLLVLWATRRKQEQPRQQTMYSNGPYPPVVVVQPPHAAGSGMSNQPGYLPSYAQDTPREFRVVGGEIDEPSLFGEYFRTRER